MTQVRCQFRQELVDVGAPAIPCGDAVNRGRVPKIVQARLVTGAALAPDACGCAQTTESRSDRRSSQWLSIALAKEWAMKISCTMPDTLRVVGAYKGAYTCAQRYD